MMHPCVWYFYSMLSILAQIIIAELHLIQKYKWWKEVLIIHIKEKTGARVLGKEKVWVKERESGLGTVGKSGRSLASLLPTPPMRGCRVTNCLKAPAVHKCRTQLSRLLLQWLLCQHLALIIGASRYLLLRLLTAKMFCESGWKKLFHQNFCTFYSCKTFWLLFSDRRC